ncbi:MAG TPA: S8 family serine peptidase [Kofleriaceae bacterium]
MKRLWYPVAFAAAAAAGCGSDGPQLTPGGGGDVHLSPAVMAQMESLIAEKAARTPVQRKISSSLLYARSGRFDAQLAAQDPDRRITSLHQVDAQGRVLVDIRGDMSAMTARIEPLGGSVVDLRSRSARAWMPLEAMEQLASESAVKTIHPAYLATTRRIDKPGGGTKWQTGSRADRIAAVQAAEAAWAASDPPRTSGGATRSFGSVASEGDKAQAADHARRFYGSDGTGVKVGILSDSDDFKEQAIATGDLLPNTTTVPGQDGRPGAGEGTAMMEIVHDLAPGADLFFATAFTSPESFADNIRALRFQFHCDIIIDDVIYFFESPYQDDIIAQAVDDVTADGAMYFSSAGNEGNVDDGTSGTWEGDFKPSGSLATLPDSGYTVHSFGSGVIEDRIEVGGGPLILHWSDPGTLDNPASSNDYDLFVLDNDLRNVVLAATDIQDGTGAPFEFLGFNIPAGFRVVIAAHPGAEVRAIRTVIFGGELANSTSGSVYGHNSAADAFAVAAVDAAEAGGAAFTAGPTTPIELFSSDGPRRIFFDRNGNPINPANPGLTFASRGGTSRAKPDLAAADGVTTTLPAGSGLSPFFGTSAAAPHAGAIAALIKSVVPNATPAKIRSAMLSGAIDIEESSTDRNSGRGIASAFGALSKAGAKPAVSLAAGAVTVHPLGSDAVLPGGTAQVTVALDNLGGAAATAVSATLTSSSPSVLILQGASAYPAIPVEGSTTGATAFAFFVDPAAPCGATLPFTLTVSFTGNAGNNPRPAVLSFSVQTGRPSTTAMHVAYTGGPVAIPDGDSAGVDIPLAVSGFPGSVARAVFNLDGTACSAAIGATTVGVDHTFVGDLTFTLTSPSGRTIKLFDRAGGPNNGGNNFCQMFLDDAAASPIQGVASAQAPFTGTFRPLQALSAFTGDTGSGTWILHATDNAFLDAGSVRAFSLDLSGFSCTR